MGFTFRKSVKIGPVRVNVSKSGVGVSGGVKGFRVGVNAKGKTYVSVGAKGFRYQTQLGSAKPKKKTSPQQPEQYVFVPPAEKIEPSSLIFLLGIILFIISFFLLDNFLVGIVCMTIGIVCIVVAAIWAKLAMKKAEEKNNQVFEQE